jgi:hypothetical protein
MYDLFLKSDHRHLAEISDEEMQFLIDNLEEESLTDDDYTLTRLTLEYLRGNGMGPRLASVLDSALGAADEVEIVYQQKV